MRIFLLISLALIGCKSNINTIANTDKLNQNPPGCVKISDNLFADKTEIANIDYKEYQHWTNRIFGSESVQFNQTILDTSVWEKVDGLSNLSKSYHRDERFYNYPVVGVSLQQAKLYTKWRRERVIEKTLIDLSIISFDLNQTPDNYFTLDHFIDGKYTYIKGDKTLTEEGIEISYPEYKIPNAKEWELISGIETNDILDSYTLDKYNKEVMRENKFLFNTKEYQESKENRQAEAEDTNGKRIITSPINSFAVNKYGMYGVIGNVSEIIDIEGFSKGENWNTSLHSFDKEKNNTFVSTNAWTGFRNICYMKVVKIKSGG